MRSAKLAVVQTNVVHAARRTLAPGRCAKQQNSFNLHNVANPMIPVTSDDVPL